ncbi:DUF3343 domain-containing protein [Saccharibacillus deserti]|uniref:DUF3343 domain-containing protein n=1 Tax=Saccharibacillus deserti TaxID=1634444 RepID=UPI0015568BBC|nr:DUF3343 domain-containing protein [Saccharibacillus deserti]
MSEREWVLAFDSSQQALRAEMLMDENQVEFDLIPTPGAITAGCAISLAFDAKMLESVQTVVEAEKIEIRGLFRSNGTGYQQLV